MNQIFREKYGHSLERVEKAFSELLHGRGVIIVDNEARENEGDLVFAAELLHEQQMAMLIRECSGIVCLCLTDEKVRQLDLPMMVTHNTSKFQTAFTISVEAASDITTGVSARDRLVTVKTLIDDNVTIEDYVTPGHVFPLRAKRGGVLEREGHTEATVDLCRLAGLQPYGVLCELTNPDGSMARMPDIMEFSEKNNMHVLTVEDIVLYRKKHTL